jgi:hypothetical protein
MRALKAVTIVMGVLIVLGTAALVVAIVGRLSGGGPTATVQLDEPAGTRILGIAPVRDRLAVALTGGGADRIVVLDTARGRVVGRVELAR